MVSKLVTSRSIWRSALLISLAIGCSSPAPRAPVSGNSRGALVLTNADVFAPGGHVTSLTIPTAGEGRQEIDLQGKSVIVGLTDAHCHLYGLGVDLENVSVRDAEDETHVARMVAEAAKSRPAGEWLIGRGWDQNKWYGLQFPHRFTLDAAISDRPVMLRRVDGHAAWLNSRALEAAGITKDTKDPPGGKILREADGEPRGVLIDNAMDLVDAKLPRATPDVIERRILAAAKIATELGFTAVHEMGIDWETAAVYEKLAAENRLPLRVYAYLAGDPNRAEELRTRTPKPAVGRFVMRGVKFFSDGALGSRGARLHDDYSDEPGNRGIWVTEPALLGKAVDAAVAGGWQVAIHAIGDAGIGSVLDAYAKHSADKRLRIEHLQVFAPKDLPRIVRSRAIASMQPTHATSDSPWAEARVGDRIEGGYAWRTVLDHKIPLAFGSDFPVEEVDPLLGLDAAVNRGGWRMEQKLTLDEAVAAFTTGATFAAKAEDAKLADATIFDGPLTEGELRKRKVVMTIVGGEIVYDAGVLTRRAAR